jgi:hypothetical protein
MLRHDRNFACVGERDRFPSQSREFAMNRLRDWIESRKVRRRALRWSVATVLTWVLFWVLKTVLGRAGFVAQVLAPSAGVKMFAAIAGAAVLVVLRFGLVFLAPMVLTILWVNALWPTRWLEREQDRRSNQGAR